mmetsp:Transcript_17955/g.15869  ORF Transcript_17955/g.15869 Transcript_17955/m.15869 type:complete len:124 (+) Transcript_17955:1010-1381(+)
MKFLEKGKGISLTDRHKRIVFSREGKPKNIDIIKAFKDEKNINYSVISNYLVQIMKSQLNSSLREGKIMKLVDTIARSVTLRNLEKNEVLFSKGDKISGLFVLVKGRIGLSKKEGDVNHWEEI